MAFGPQQPGSLFRHLKGVGQEHDRGLQSLGPVHRHHPNRVPFGLFQVSLDLNRARFQPVQETLQRRRVVPLEILRQVEEHGDRVLGLAPEAGEQHAASAERAEQPGIELERRHRVGGAEKRRQTPVCRGKGAPFGRPGAE